jgi:ankyrin repeat protein
VNAKDHHGNTCLHLLFKASARPLLYKPGAFCKVLQTLLALGADTNCLNKNNKTVLHLAIESTRDRAAALIAVHPGRGDMLNCVD